MESSIATETVDLNAIETLPAELPAAVRKFFESTEKAQYAFDILRSRVEALQAELNDTNAQLRNKVTELDRLSGHLVSLLDSMSDGVVAIDNAERICLFNPAAETLCGYQGSQLLGRSLEHWLAPDSELLQSIRQALLEAKRFPRRKCLLPRADGSSHPVAVSVTTVSDKQCGTIGVVVVLQDLGELTALQREVQRSARLAEIGRMASVVAHEIRNPLGGIEGFAALLQDDLKDHPEKKRYAEYILSGISDLKNIVTSLLDLARQPELRVETLDLALLLNELTELTLADRGLNTGAIERRFYCDARQTRICADRGALRQIFLNLMRNAVEAMLEQGRGELRVRLLDQDSGEPAGSGMIVAEIADTGTGVPAKLRDSLFQPFFTTKSKGSGLGLPMVAKLVEAHGGQVRYVDEPGGGSCFQVLLPVQPELYFLEGGHANRTHSGRR